MKQRKDSVTLNDVAVQAGVSKFTVSVVLNGSRSNTRVSEETRQRIVTAARDLRYHPNTLARSLTNRRTNIYGFYIGFANIGPRAIFLSEIMSGIQSECVEVGKDLLIHRVSRHFSAEQVYGSLMGGTVDGLIMYSPPDDPLVPLLMDAPIPVVTVADKIEGLPSVSVDDVRGAQLQVEHLLARGHRRVLYRMGGHGAASLIKRREVFLQYAAAKGMEVVEVLNTVEIPFTNPYPHPMNETEKSLLFDTSANRITAAVCWTDASAYSLLRECTDGGLRVPNDLAVVGFNGIAIEMPLRWDLTTIRAPWADVGRSAVAYLTTNLQEKEGLHETVLPVELAVGETT